MLEDDMRESVEALGGGQRPHEVFVFFDCDDSMASWHVRHASIREAVSRPYLLDLSLVTPDLDTDTDELVGRTCQLTIQSTRHARAFRGVIARVRHGGTRRIHGSTEYLAVGLEVVPALAMLGQRINCRIFQDMRVREILQDVLLGESVPAGDPAEGLRAYHRTVDLDALNETNEQPPRDYCVQYKESDLDFVSRLMHEEGIVYVLDQHEDDNEVVRLIDSEGALPALDLDGQSAVPVDSRLADGRPCITSFGYERAASPTRAAVRHYDWLAPPDPVHHGGMTFTLGRVAENDREIYIPSERRIRECYDGRDISRLHDDSQRDLAIALDRLMSEDFVGRGSSNVVQLGAGIVFEVDNPSEIQRMVALEVVHEITADGHDLAGLAHYDNHFTCVPSFRFRVGSSGVPRPVMRGPQTATVTGPPGEEIHTDRYGRIKILLHWDRDGEGRGRERRHDATSSVWVPVVQPWAGSGFGFVFLPRIGMEVMVAFLDGNIDRPVVTGCLYNGGNQPPYPLPEERTKSTIKTNSSPGGQGFNELRFEDSADFEEIFLHAQRDYNEVVLRNHDTNVHVDQSHRVGGDRSRVVEGDEDVRITGSRRIVISGQGNAEFRGESIRVTSDYELDVSETIHVRAPVEIHIECEGSSITMTPQSITLQAGGGAKIVLDANVLVESDEGSRASFDANVELSANAGGEIRLDGEARMTAQDGAEVLLNEDARITSNGDGHGLFQASKITVTSGDATLMLDGANVTVDGDQIGITGETQASMEGGGARTELRGGNVCTN